MTQILNTTEFENGKYVKKPQTFKAYSTPEEGFEGYASFLSQNKRYKNIIGVKDPMLAADIMSKTGYATDPKYKQKLQAIIQQLNT